MTDPLAEINDCKYLFLADIRDLGRGALQLVVQEGLPVGTPLAIEVGRSVISDCTRIEATDESRAFEIVWRRHVGYSVRNESYAAASDEEHYDGTRFRIYSKSHFIEYMSRATFATDEYPGPTRHYGVVCEDHIIDVLSVGDPAVRRLH